MIEPQHIVAMAKSGVSARIGYPFALLGVHESYINEPVDAHLAGNKARSHVAPAVHPCGYRTTTGICASVDKVMHALRDAT